MDVYLADGFLDVRVCGCKGRYTSFRRLCEILLLVPYATMTVISSGNYVFGAPSTFPQFRSPNIILSSLCDLVLVIVWRRCSDCGFTLDVAMVGISSMTDN